MVSVECLLVSQSGSGSAELAICSPSGQCTCWLPAASGQLLAGLKCGSQRSSLRKHVQQPHQQRNIIALQARCYQAVGSAHSLLSGSVTRPWRASLEATSS